ncbi:hypothetical protein BLA60_29605 [Actinophytocola xinjiangensis]|uniref:Peptidase C51 domain-containing protein n=1 Tax=Actinophytocola xinjiangensis TaxID=485602 RepID=A0A7Z0WI54_9PSEU|nr:CHAP domain-containing protein [Actinophytocola xinjiangensis]OLF07012.1 hypothetical protein BLA60_29605 [Actinophytocola xinjiangensis]
MTHKDDASALPGSAPRLAALADPVYVTADGGVFDELGARFTEAGGRTAVVTNKVRSVIGEVDGAWDGTSADSFVAYMDTFTAAGLAVTDALTNAASDLRNAGGTVQGARDALEGVFANLVTEVEAMGCPAEEGELERQVDETVARYRPQVEEQVELAGSALTDAASALSGLLEGVNPRFSTMPGPDTGTFAPTPGEPLEWIPTIPEQPGPDGQEPGGGSPGGGSPGGTAPGEAPGGTPGEPPGQTPGGGPPGGAPPAGEAPGEEVPPGGEVPPGESAPDAGAEGRILDVARGELGFEEGPGDQNKYGPADAWCSSFATWVWRESGVDIPSLPFTGDVYTWGQERGLAYDAGDLGQARPGDVLLFGTGPESTSTSTHIGIVESVNGDQVTLIEGNSSDRVQRVDHSLSSGKFYGGVHPR